MAKKNGKLPLIEKEAIMCNRNNKAIRSSRYFLFSAFYFLLLTSCLSFLFAQAPDTLWTKIHDGDWGNTVQQTLPDSGYIIAARGNGGGIYLIKTDSLGDTLWTRNCGGAEANSVQQTPDGGYVIAGMTHSYGTGDINVYLIKTDVSGNKVWTRTFGRSGNDWGYSVKQVSDGGYIIAGKTSGDVYLIKTNVWGIEQGSRTFGGTDFDCGYSVQQTTDGGYIVVGYKNFYSTVGSDVYLIKTH